MMINKILITAKGANTTMGLMTTTITVDTILILKITTTPINTMVTMDTVLIKAIKATKVIKATQDTVVTRATRITTTCNMIKANTMVATRVILAMLPILLRATKVIPPTTITLLSKTMVMELIQRKTTTTISRTITETLI